MSLKKLVVLTGAGISAESGLQTFRDANGLWENYNIEDVATPEAWNRNPDLVQEFYNKRRKQILEATPNSGHLFLKEIEKYFDVTIITQNIDDLHERASSKNIIHLHGNIRFAKSSGPKQENKLYPIEGWELKMTDTCDDAYPLRPHVVWFGEEVPMMDVAIAYCRQADILLVIGTSLQVYPAANLVHFARKECKKIIVDPSASLINISGFVVIQKSITLALDEISNELGIKKQSPR